MPPEMMTIVAPIAMMAKKDASVAVCTSVLAFQKLFTAAPVTRSGCEPASSASVSVTSTTTRRRPLSCDPAIRWTMRRIGEGGGLALAGHAGARDGLDRLGQDERLVLVGPDDVGLRHVGHGDLPHERDAGGGREQTD